MPPDEEKDIENKEEEVNDDLDEGRDDETEPEDDDEDADESDETEDDSDDEGDGEGESEAASGDADDPLAADWEALQETPPFEAQAPEPRPAPTAPVHPQYQQSPPGTAAHQPHVPGHQVGNAAGTLAERLGIDPDEPLTPRQLDTILAFERQQAAAHDHQYRRQMDIQQQQRYAQLRTELEQQRRQERDTAYVDAQMDRYRITSRNNQAMRNAVWQEVLAEVSQKPNYNDTDLENAVKRGVLKVMKESGYRPRTAPKKRAPSTGRVPKGGSAPPKKGPPRVDLNDDRARKAALRSA